MGGICIRGQVYGGEGYCRDFYFVWIYLPIDRTCALYNFGILYTSTVYFGNTFTTHSTFKNPPT